MSARSPSVKPREPQLTIAVSKVERYFPKGCTSEQMESTILKLLGKTTTASGRITNDEVAV
mgnify:CR=1 FL=1